MARPGRSFATAVSLIGAGVVALTIGLGAAFTRGSVLDVLVVPGMILLGLGALKNIEACYLGAVHWRREERMLSWWPVSASLILATLYEVWMLTQL